MIVGRANTITSLMRTTDERRGRRDRDLDLFRVKQNSNVGQCRDKKSFIFHLIHSWQEKEKLFLPPTSN